jgi:hypothetical protein
VKFTNDTGLPSAWTVAFERDGREMLVVVVKGTYAIPAPLFETDFAHRKPGCDVLLVGSAHAPYGEPTTRLEVSLKVGNLTKQFRVVGNRAWYKSAGAIAATSAEPFIVLPISYDVAFGGTDRTEEADGSIETFLPNPVGKGYWRHHDQIEGQPLPNTEQSDRVIDDPGGQFTPMAFSPLGRNWTPRLSYAGTYDEQWVANDAPFWPDDFDHRYFQAAPSDQIIPYPGGGEQIRLQNLTPDGQRAFRLPERRMPVTFIPHRGRDVTLQTNIDTIVLEPDENRFTLTWRANLPLGKSVFDVKETIIGEVSRAWRRARLSGGKQYYRSLAELVNDRRAKGGSG